MRARGIKAGDVVQVIRDCCGAYAGIVYRVGSIEFVSPPRWLHCAHCGWEASGLAAAWNAQERPPRIAVVPASWLRRFDAPAEPASEIERLYASPPLPRSVVIIEGQMWAIQEDGRLGWRIPLP